MAIGDFFSGIGKQAWGTVTGTWEAVTNPVETAKAVGYAVSHPVDTFKAVTSSVGDAFSENPAEASGRAAFEVALLFTPAGLTKVANAAKAAKAAKATATVGKVADKTADAAKIAKTAETASDAAKVAKTADTASDASKTVEAADSAGDAAKATKAASLSDDVLKSIDRLPKKTTDNFGHGVKKHGPKSPTEAAGIAKEQAEATAAGKKFKDVTWFGDDAKLAKAIESAPEQLQGILKENPQKLKEFEAFLANKKEGASFGFRYQVPGETSLGTGIASDGSKIATDATAYIKYNWARTKGGELAPQVFTAYPVGVK